MIINFSVESERILAILGTHRLVTTLKIDDFQTDRCQRYIRPLIVVVLIWPAVMQFLCCTSKHRSGWLFAKMRIPQNSTHVFPSPLPLRSVPQY